MMKEIFHKKALLLLQDGTIFYGKAISSEGTSFGEICFNTGMTGYQEVFTDPSYFGQMMVMSNAHIGNYGVHKDELQSNDLKIACLVCRNFSFTHSGASFRKSLKENLEAEGLFGIYNVDTRALVSHIRDHGSMNAVISTNIDSISALKEKLKEQPSMKGLELASKVSTKESYTSGDSNAGYKVALIDLGVKRNIIESLTSRGVFVKVFPYNASFEEVSSWNPDGYVLSNGPGDPEPLVSVQEFARKVIAARKPFFGICLGHQIIALANGVATFKMHSGHRGINHPIRNIQTGKGEITSQNHGFAVDRSQVEQHKDLEISHLHINDGTVAGIEMKNAPCFSVQYHPEAGPGPNDSKYLFDKFVKLIKKHK